MNDNSTFRQELEKLRVVGVDEDSEQQNDENPRQATEDFVEKIKSDAAQAPTVEETIPKEEK